MDEPRAVPPYEDVDDTRWYCLDCPCHSSGRLAMANHWTVNHGDQGEKPTDGVDISPGWQVRVMLYRRRNWILEQSNRLAQEMHEGFGAEDFVAEAEIRSA